MRELCGSVVAARGKTFVFAISGVKPSRMLC